MKKILFIIFFSLTFGVTLKVSAQNAFCAGFEKTYSVISGGFDGNTSLAASDEGFLVPKL